MLGKVPKQKSTPCPKRSSRFTRETSAMGAVFVFCSTMFCDFVLREISFPSHVEPRRHVDEHYIYCGKLRKFPLRLSWTPVTMACANPPATTTATTSRVAGDEVISEMNLGTLTLETLTEDATLEFCQRLGLLPTSVQCPSCGQVLTKLTVRQFSAGDRRESLNFRCHKKTCRKTLSARTNTWFEGIHISLRKSLFLTYEFIVKSSYERTLRETSGKLFNGRRTSSETVADHFSYCREVRNVKMSTVF